MAKEQYQVGKPCRICNLPAEHNTALRGTDKGKPEGRGFLNGRKELSRAKGQRKFLCLFATEQNTLRLYFRNARELQILTVEKYFSVLGLTALGRLNACHMGTSGPGLVQSLSLETVYSSSCLFAQ
jgi:hypothetical protein